MSRYLIRHVEAKYNIIDGTAYRPSDLPEDAKEGSIWRVYNMEHRFYRKTADGWQGQNSCPTEWRLLKGYVKLAKKPDEDRMTGTETFSDIESGEHVIFEKNTEFSNNGGCIRDDYISTHGLSDRCPFKNRGIPEDISPETMEEMKYNGKIRGYDHTWCMLSEWESFYESETERILGYIEKANEDVFRKKTNEKLDFIINNMKNPQAADPTPLYKKDDEDAYYDSPEYIKDEYMPNLMLISEEIGKISLIAEWNGIYSDDVRIIYYIQ